MRIVQDSTRRVEQTGRYPSTCSQGAITSAIVQHAYLGATAQRLVDRRPADFHNEGDEENAFELSVADGVLPRHCDHVGDDTHLRYLDRLRAEARRLVRQLAMPIGALARELILRETMSGPEVELLLWPILG